MNSNNIDVLTKNRILSASEGVLLDVVKKHDLNLTYKRGDGRSYMRGSCPKCGSSESLFINTVSEKYFCKGCDFKGKGAVTYLYQGVYKGDKTKWVDTLKELADFTNTIIP